MSEKEIGAFPPIPEKRFFTIGEAAELVGGVTSVVRYDYGSPQMQHWEVGGK